MSYIYQHPDFGLGNFINLTPAIQFLYHVECRRIPVYFAKDYVRKCFLNWEAIEILDRKPDTGPLFGSNLVNPENDRPDYQYVFEHITATPWHHGWHTYVDNVPMTRKEMSQFDAPYLLIINGSGSDAPEYVSAKDPGEAVYRTALQDLRKMFATKVYAVGSESDAKRAPYLADIADRSFFGDIRQALKLIGHHGCRGIISNDCGLAHAAGAMNQPLFMLWKNTPRERCKNAGTNTTYWYL